MKPLLTHICWCLFFIASPTRAWSKSPFFFSPDLYASISRHYDKDAYHRVKAWQNLIENNQSTSEWNKINKVNRFFNLKIDYQDDLPLWGIEDYWASPLETIRIGKGDCEDYTIAKYFSLLALGLAESKLRLMYARLLSADKPHMVLAYFEEPASIPLILDNFNPQIVSANYRQDLKLIYSFNSQGIWMADSNGIGRKINNNKGVSAFTKLLQKISASEMQSFIDNYTLLRTNKKD